MPLPMMMPTTMEIACEVLRTRGNSCSGCGSAMRIRARLPHRYSVSIHAQPTTDYDWSAATPPRAQSGRMRHGRLRRLRYKILPAVPWRLWERALRRSWSSLCPFETTELPCLDAHNRRRVSPTPPRSTKQMEYRYPNERNDEREFPQSVRRSEP